MKSNFSFFTFLVFILFSTLVEAQWVKQSNGLPDTWNLGWAIDALDSNNAIISINTLTENLIFKTPDGGNSWFQVQLPDTIYENIIDISMPKPSKIWLATGLGKILASFDGGQSWIVQFDDTSKTGFMNYVEMFDEQNGVAMGDAPWPFQGKPALFLITSNGGVDWNNTEDTTLIDVWSGDAWRRLDFTDPMHGYFFESGINPQKLLKTIDSGNNWTQTPYNGYVTTLKCYNENIVLVCDGGISRTIDGGTTWNYFALSPGWGKDIEFIPGKASEVFLTDYDYLFFSSDTGATWNTVIVDTTALNGRDIVFTDEKHGWILGDHGSLYKTSDGGVLVNVSEPNNSFPSEFSLSQNYPNPFNPVTTIKYTIPNVTLNLSSRAESRDEWSRVTLKVYDILGSEVATLVNEEQAPGNYVIEFKSTVGSLQLASGIYFYQLKAGSFTETKKMILLK